MAPVAKRRSLRDPERIRLGPSPRHGRRKSSSLGGPSIEANPVLLAAGVAVEDPSLLAASPFALLSFHGLLRGRVLAGSSAGRVGSRSLRRRNGLRFPGLASARRSSAPDQRNAPPPSNRRITGNSHRSEMSLDKFWNTAWPAGALGLIEFQAVESPPRPDWMSGVALALTCLAAYLLEARTPRNLKKIRNEIALTSYCYRNGCGTISRQFSTNSAPHGFQLHRPMHRKILGLAISSASGLAGR